MQPDKRNNPIESKFQNILHLYTIFRGHHAASQDQEILHLKRMWLYALEAEKGHVSKQDCLENIARGIDFLFNSAIQESSYQAEAQNMFMQNLSTILMKEGVDKYRAAFAENNKQEAIKLWHQDRFCLAHHLYTFLTDKKTQNYLSKFFANTKFIDINSLPEEMTNRFHNISKTADGWLNSIGQNNLYRDPYTRFGYMLGCLLTELLSGLFDFLLSNGTYQAQNYSLKDDSGRGGSPSVFISG